MYIKNSFEKKLHIVSLHLSGFSIAQLSRDYQIDKRSIRLWIGLYKRYGTDGLKKRPYRQYVGEFKAMVVREALEKGVSLLNLEIDHRVDRSTIRTWIRQVKLNGYDSLYISDKCIIPSVLIMGREKKEKSSEDFAKLQAENAQLRAELALLKKVRALVLEKENQQHGVGSKPSKH